jgi:hypothetical protein
MEIVEGSPPYDAAEIISLMATRVICDVLAGQVRSGNLANRRTLRRTEGLLAQVLLAFPRDQFLFGW